MYEGPRSYGEEDDEIREEEPFDYVEHAKKLRQEREAAEATKKAERVTKEASKKADKEARLAKKIADKATQKLEEKTNILAEASEDTKEVVAEAREEVTELRQALTEAVSAAHEDEYILPAPAVEMAFTEGSEYIAKLEEGEEAIFDLTHTIDKAEEKVNLADEVKEQAEALARARAALESVDVNDIGVSFEGHEENSVVFGETGPQDDVRDRLKQTWEHQSDAAVDLSPTQPIEQSNVENDDETRDFAPSVGPYWSVAESSGSNAYSQNETPKIVELEKNNEPEPISEPNPVGAGTGNSIKQSTTFRGEIFDSHNSSIKDRLEKSASVLDSGTADLKKEIQTAQHSPVATRESTFAPRHNQAPRPASVAEGPVNKEVRGTNEPAIPSWIGQIERDVKKGRAPELKKWQIDVLRAQHPDILKRYDKLDRLAKEQIKEQSRETIRGVDAIFEKPHKEIEPGELPAPAYTMPAYMIPSVPSAPEVPKAPTPAYEYAMSSSAESNGSAFSSESLTLIFVGGLLFGAALIAAFGL